MTSVAAATHPKALQLARAERLRELVEPWTPRKLQARTGVGRSVWQSRLNGETAIAMPEIELLAPVLRMTPVELFSDLLAVRVNDEGPASEETGPMVHPPGLEPGTH